MTTQLPFQKKGDKQDLAVLPSLPVMYNPSAIKAKTKLVVTFDHDLQKISEKLLAKRARELQLQKMKADQAQADASSSKKQKTLRRISLGVALC